MIVSVIIPTHNRVRGLSELLDDLRMQELPDHLLEVLVVDSNEGEPTEAVVADRLAMGLDVKLLMTANVVSAKRNCGAKEATGELLIFVDDDMRVGPHFVQAHVRASEGQRSVVSGAVDFPTKWVLRSNYYRYKDSKHRSPRIGAVTEELISPHNIVSMNLSMRRETFSESGGFNESFISYGGEDLEFGYRCARLGLTLVYAPSARAWHYETTSDISGFASKIYTATYYGTPVLLQESTDAESVLTFRWTEPRLARSPRDKCVALIISMLSRASLTKACVAALRKTDHASLVYNRIFYDVVTMLVVRTAVRDRLKGTSRPDLFR